MSAQAVHAFDFVTHSVEGQGVVTQRVSVLRLAQTGRYSFVHICLLGSEHAITFVDGVSITIGLDSLGGLDWQDITNALIRISINVVIALLDLICIITVLNKKVRKR